MQRYTNLKTIPALLALVFGASGCSLLYLAVLGGSAAETQSSREERAARRAEQKKAREEERRKRAAEAEAREKAIFEDIETMRQEIATTKDVENKAEPFATRVMEASRTSAARSGKVDMPELYAEAAGYLEQAIKKNPSLDAFNKLAALPPSDATDSAVLASCPRVRPLVKGDAVHAFTGACLDSAHGDAKKLKWPNAKRDVTAYMKIERDRELAAAAAAKKEREEQAKTARYVAAAVFASGRCKFGNCLKDGWTMRTDDGDIDVRCSFSDCFKDGWTARFPDGSEARTRCSFSNCTKDGWTTSFPDGSEARTRCSFSNCLKDGWTTDLPGGGTARTRCSFSDCSTNGWETSLPDGRDVRCRCSFSKCFENGATCD